MPALPDIERRKARRLHQLGTINPVCGTCGETDWRCMEEDHVADYRRDETTVILCRNCHRKKSDAQLDHPPFDPNVDPMLDRIAHFLFGLADLLIIIVERLIAFGHALVVRAANAPSV